MDNQKYKDDEELVSFIGLAKSMTISQYEAQNNNEGDSK